MAIVDSFESLTSTQFHRDAVSADRAAEEIIKHAGKKYDPKLVQALQKALPVMKKVRDTYSDQLGDLINLDFAAAAVKPQQAPKPAAPKIDVTALARAAARLKAREK
jgi:hypothetical protein